MIKRIKKGIINILKRFGYSIVRFKGKSNEFPDIVDSQFWEFYEICKPFTMTSIERMYSLYCSVNYIIDNNIKGDFVECGVWRGGSSMMIALILDRRNISDRSLFLYDTFEGMSEPINSDISFEGNDAKELLKNAKRDKNDRIWCIADLEDVKNNLYLTGFPFDKLHFIKGKVEVTIPEFVPQKDIALLRLDTDFYESTFHELTWLFPKLVRNGVLIIDDYGHWKGCRKAVDEYFKSLNFPIFLNRIDYTGRLLIKPS